MNQRSILRLLRLRIDEAFHGLEDDWVVNGLIAARLQVDFEKNGRKSDKAKTKKHHQCLINDAIAPILYRDAFDRYKGELSRQLFVDRLTARRIL